MKYDTYATLKSSEERAITFKWPSGKLGKDIGIKQINLTMRLFGYFGSDLSGSTKSDKQILADRAIMIQIPKLRIGDTIPEITEYGTRQNLSLTLLWWKESNIAVKEWSENYYYTFTAKPGMKFVILAYRFKNNWIRAQTTPYLSSGEIATDKGYIFSVWTAPGGLSSKEHKPRTATIDETRDLMGKSGAFKQLLPGESTEGNVIYEIPADTNPIEATLVYVPYLIEYKSSS